MTKHRIWSRLRYELSSWFLLSLHLIGKAANAASGVIWLVLLELWCLHSVLVIILNLLLIILNSRKRVEIILLVIIGTLAGVLLGIGDSGELRGEWLDVILFYGLSLRRCHLGLEMRSLLIGIKAVELYILLLSDKRLHFSLLTLDNLGHCLIQEVAGRVHSALLVTAAQGSLSSQAGVIRVPSHVWAVVSLAASM